MNKYIFGALLISSVLLNASAYAGLQKQTPYAPPSEKQYWELKSVFKNISDKDIEKSIRISQKRENIDLINNILVFLQYKKLIKQTKKLPPIFLVYSDNGILTHKGGVYYDNKNIIILNANMLAANGQYGKLQKNLQTAVDFVTIAPILSHELMHYEDYVNASSIPNMDGFALSEWKAYKRSEKTIEYFLKMTKAEADEIMPVDRFYDLLQHLEEYMTDMRKNYIKSVDAADIFLNNENKICKTFAINKDMFKMIGFFPLLQFNAKNGGHIVLVDSDLFNIPMPLKFSINILNGELKVLNSSAEIEAIKTRTKNIKVIDKNSYLILR